MVQEEAHRIFSAQVSLPLTEKQNASWNCFLQKKRQEIHLVEREKFTS